MNFEYDNQAKTLKLEVLTRVARHTYQQEPEDVYDRDPYDMIPGPLPSYRCCIYKEREIIRERILSARGKNQPGQPDAGILGVLPAACEGCPIQRFRVTDNCQSCLSHKCVEMCAFGAITVTPRGAYIDPTKCRECGRCAAVCPYNAISDTLRPCVKACPVKAIGKDETLRSVIDYGKCINCGSCMKNCPFGAITDRSRMVDVIRALQGEVRVTAVFAPAAEGHFGTADVGKIKNAIRRLGFDDAVEVSLGADAVAAHEALELRGRLQKDEKMTTSCCPAFVEMVRKHFPQLIGDVSSTVSPMTAVARYLRARDPGTAVVFIGPCVAKKAEILSAEDSADYVLTFEELAAMFAARDINVAEAAEAEQDGSRFGRGFAQSGGVAAAVAEVFKEKDFGETFACETCDGARECKKALAVLAKGRVSEDFIEGMACPGGCVAGPAGLAAPEEVRRNRVKLAAGADGRTIGKNLTGAHDFSQVDMRTRTRG